MAPAVLKRPQHPSPGCESAVDRPILSNDGDELYEAAVEVIIREGRGSVSLLQRALGVGYGRGARLIDCMAEEGVVGAYVGSQAREVLITIEEWAARNGTERLPPDPGPRKLRIQPHAAVAIPQADHEHDFAAEANFGGRPTDDWDADGPARA